MKLTSICKHMVNSTVKLNCLLEQPRKRMPRSHVKSKEGHVLVFDFGWWRVSISHDNLCSQLQSQRDRCQADP